MIRIANAQLWVHDQDEALAFYTQKLGWEVGVDVTVPELGNFRWLTVSPPAQEDFAVVLMAIPGPPVMDAETSEQVKARNIDVETYKGVVSLSGFVESKSEAERAVTLAQKVDGVKSVKDDMHVRN